MVDSLAKIADNDTPKAVEVPGTMAGVAVWALGRWGIGVVFAAAAYLIYQDFRIESNRVYADNKTANIALLMAYQDQTKVNAQVASAIDRLSEAVNRDRINQDEVVRNTRRIEALENSSNPKTK